MKKFDIDNINISLTQHDSQNDPNELAKSFQDRLEQVVTVWETHQSIEDLYFEEQEKLMQQNIVSTSTEGGAAATTNPNAQPFAASTTPSVTRGIITTNSGNSSIPSFSFPNLTANEGTATNQSEFADSQPVISTVPASQSTASSTAVALNDSINPYSGISSQQTITIPQETNESETTGLIQKIKDKRDLAAKNNDTAAVEYWNKLLTKLEEGTAISTLLVDKEVTENPLFAEFKSMTQPTNEMLSFNWETVRLKMIAAIDSKIINGNRDKQSVEYWKAIRARLSKSDCNVANLFEEYDELFLLLKEVEGLTELPSRITFFTPTKVYPDLSPDKMYANLGIDDIYVFLKTNRTIEREGAGVNKGAVYIKNSTANSFITGETIEFGLNEELVNASKRSKEDINWVVYNGATKKGSKTFMNEGTSFNYNFSSPGKYIIEAYGGTKGATKKATKKQSAFVEVTIVNQEIEIILPQSIKNGVARPFATEKSFVVKLKENKVAKPLHPVTLSYQIQFKGKGKDAITITEAKLLPNDGVINLAMPELGTYTLLVKSNDQYAIKYEKQWRIIENYVESVQIIKNEKPNNAYLHLDTPQEVTFAVKKFKIEPPTTDEMAKVKWVIYNEKELKSFNNDKTKIKQPFAKGTKATFKLPLTEGNYYVEAYSNNPEGNKFASSQKIQIVHPCITEARWTDAQGDKKEITGFKGETAFIKASIPNFGNQKVRVLFYVKKSANAAYSKEYEYYSDTTTDANGNINKQIVFNDKMKSEFKLGNGENAFLKIDFVGYVNNEVYRFKEAKYNAKDVEIQLTTKRQLLDLYFEYDGRRVMEKDRVPYDTKKVEFIKLIAKTRNMAGEKINFTAHGLGQSDVLGKIGETVVKNNGVATIAVSSNTIWGLDSIFLPKVKTKIFYAGIEGFSTKHIENKTLVLEVGAKWDNSKFISSNLKDVLKEIGKTRLKTKKEFEKLDNRILIYLDALKTAMKDNKIDTNLKAVHFLAQVMHESGELRWTEELKVLDTAYGGYKGRGLIQLTGKTNYTNYGKFVNEDVTSTLENKMKLESNPHAAKSAGWFWNKVAELNDDAERNDFIYITFVVNGGLNGYDLRLKYLKNGFTALKINKNLDYKFEESKAYDNLKYSFGWGLWHDSTTSKQGATKNNTLALQGYERFISLHDKNGKNGIKSDWYNYNKKKIRSFVETRIKQLKDE